MKIDKHLTMALLHILQYIVSHMFVIVGSTEMEALLLYVARNSEQKNVLREDYQRHHDT